MSYCNSIDTGGTFTDIIVLNEPTGRLHIGKALTTPNCIFDGMHEAIGVVAKELGLTTEAMLAGPAAGTRMPVGVLLFAEPGADLMLAGLLRSDIATALNLENCQRSPWT